VAAERQRAGRRLCRPAGSWRRVARCRHAGAGLERWPGGGGHGSPSERDPGCRRQRAAHIAAPSGLDADLSSPFCHAVSYGYTERLLAESGCSVSIARASVYSEFSAGFRARARASGQLRLPAADGRMPLVARCLAALARAPATGRHHDITGSQSLGLDAIAAAGTHQWGTPLTHLSVAPGQHCAEMAAAGEDPWWMHAYSTMFASIREQRWAAVSAEVHLLTGRSPTPVRTPSPLQAGLMDRHNHRPRRPSLTGPTAGVSPASALMSRSVIVQ
jgi:hypothetical protein